MNDVDHNSWNEVCPHGISRKSNENDTGRILMSSNDARGESFPASELVEMIKSCNNARKYSIFIVVVTEENYEVKLLL